MRHKHSLAGVGLVLLNVCMAQAALSDDLDAQAKYNQQRTRWKIEETRRKIEADRARMQSQMQQGQSNTVGSLSSSSYGAHSTSSAYANRAANQARQPIADTTQSQMAVRQFFQQYKSMDLSNNTQIMNLYANDARIDVLGTPYTKASYTQYVTNAYHHPAGGLNTHTRYSEPVIQQVTGDSAQMKFSGALGSATMTVFWTLRKSPSGSWQIASERFVNGIH